MTSQMSTIVQQSEGKNLMSVLKLFLKMVITVKLSFDVIISIFKSGQYTIITLQNSFIVT